MRALADTARAVLPEYQAAVFTPDVPAGVALDNLRRAVSRTYERIGREAVQQSPVSVPMTIARPGRGEQGCPPGRGR